MKLSFDDEDSFNEAAGGGSIRFNNPPSDPDTLALQRVGSNSSMPPQDSERHEDICVNIPPRDSNTIRQPGLGVGSHGSSSEPEKKFEIASSLR